jgi:hypothetical protein
VIQKSVSRKTGPHWSCRALSLSISGSAPPNLEVLIRHSLGGGAYMATVSVVIKAFGVSNKVTRIRPKSDTCEVTRYYLHLDVFQGRSQACYASPRAFCGYGPTFGNKSAHTG